jgi:hypothetical protein
MPTLNGTDSRQTALTTGEVPKNPAIVEFEDPAVDRYPNTWAKYRYGSFGVFSAPAGC